MFPLGGVRGAKALQELKDLKLLSVASACFRARSLRCLTGRGGGRLNPQPKSRNRGALCASRLRFKDITRFKSIPQNHNRRLF